MNANHGQLSEKLNKKIVETIDSEEGRQLAGAIAELYITSLRKLRTYEITQSAIISGRDRPKSQILSFASDFVDASYHMAKFINDRDTQDSLRLATPQNSSKRIGNTFDMVINIVNEEVGIKVPDHASTNFAHLKQAFKPYRGGST